MARENRIKELKTRINFKPFTNTCSSCMYRVAKLCTKHKYVFSTRRTGVCDDYERKYNAGAH